MKDFNKYKVDATLIQQNKNKPGILEIVDECTDSNIQ
jgi:hypothetical protein